MNDKIAIAEYNCSEMHLDWLDRVETAGKVLFAFR